MGGQPPSEEADTKELGLGQKVTDLHDPIARWNFRLVIIRPDEVERVERVDISDPATARR